MYHIHVPVYFRMFKLKVDLLQGLVLKPTHSDSCAYLLKWSQTLETGSLQTTWKGANRDYRKKKYVK